LLLLPPDPTRSIPLTVATFVDVDCPYDERGRSYISKLAAETSVEISVEISVPCLSKELFITVGVILVSAEDSTMEVNSNARE
jgi:hypothetical protein